MPSTASFISSSLVGMPLNINSVSDNIRMSAALLSYLADIEGNNRCDTIAAYYEGALNLSQYGVFPEIPGLRRQRGGAHPRVRVSGRATETRPAGSPAAGAGVPASTQGAVAAGERRGPGMSRSRARAFFCPADLHLRGRCRSGSRLSAP